MSGSKGVFAEAIEKDSNTSPEQGHGFAWEWRAVGDEDANFWTIKISAESVAKIRLVYLKGIK